VTAWATFLLGLGLGLRHAADADHLAVVAALVQREPGMRKALWIAALWGTGHATTFLGLGLLVVLFEVRLPPVFEPIAEVVVGAMLLAVGGWNLARSLRGPIVYASARRNQGHLRAWLVGVIHGLSGSAGIALLAATTIPAPLVAMVYLCLVALGTVFGMVLITAALAYPMGKAASSGSGFWARAVGIGSSLLSMVLGCVALTGA
jgi:nickel/cobalt transporter (NicO) family protein